MGWTPRGLRIFNAVVALLQLLTGIGILIITDKKSTLPWYTNFPVSYRKGNSGFYMPVVKQVASLPIGVYAGVFLLLSAINHFVVILPGINSIYNDFLCRNMNPFRWLEYFLSASIMHVMIAQLAGVTDVHLLFTIFGLTAATMWYGWLMERANGTILPTYQLSSFPSEEPTCVSKAQGQFMTDDATAHVYSPDTRTQGGAKVDWSPFVLGFLPHLFAWAVIFCYFFSGITRASAPAWIWAIVIVLFFIDLLFAVNQALQFAQVPGWRGFGGGEFWYIMLSVTAKQLLAWINYGGTKRFS